MIYNIVNEKVLNPFNPTYSIHIYEDNIINDLKLDFLKNFLLNFEKEALKKIFFLFRRWNRIK
jgi:hypothetical protein